MNGILIVGIFMEYKPYLLGSGSFSEILYFSSKLKLLVCLLVCFFFSMKRLFYD